MAAYAYEEEPNPITQVHDLVFKNCWSVLWENPEALALEVPGHWSSYRVFLIWKPHIRAFHLSIALGIDVVAEREGVLWEMLARVNARQWLGHFDVCAQESILYYRHAVLAPGGESLSPCYLEHLLSTALQEVESLYPVFNLVAQGVKTPQQALNLSILSAPTSGQSWKC